MRKAYLISELARQTNLKKDIITSILDSLRSVATKQLKDTGKFKIPGLVNIKKTRVKAATKESEHHMFGRIVVVKAKPEQAIVRAYGVTSLKRSLEAHF